MSRILYFDCFNGASGDMVLGALVDAGLPLEELRRALGSLALDGAEVSAKQVLRAGVSATKFIVTEHGHNAHTHEHDHHDHDHGHVHSSIVDRPSAIGDRPSAIGDRPSAIVHRPSSIVHRPSAIVHRPSSIVHRRRSTMDD